MRESAINSVGNAASSSAFFINVMEETVERVTAESVSFLRDFVKSFPEPLCFISGIPRQKEGAEGAKGDTTK